MTTEFDAIILADERSIILVYFSKHVGPNKVDWRQGEGQARLVDPNHRPPDWTVRDESRRVASMRGSAPLAALEPRSFRPKDMEG